MEKVLVGIDDEAASQVAVDWVIERARRTPLHVTLFTALDMLGSNPITDDQLLETTAARIVSAAPGSQVKTITEDRSILEGIVELT